MSKIRFYEKSGNIGCTHQIVVVGREESLDYHSRSPLHYGVCLQCKEKHEWEIRHLDYTVVGCNNPDIYFMNGLDFSDLFEYNKEYTEREVIETLVLTYKPDYIMSRRRCLYTKEKGIIERNLYVD